MVASRSQTNCKMQCNDQHHVSSRQQRKLAYRARNRLLSIHRDAQNLKERVYSALLDDYSSRSIKNPSLQQRIRSFPWLPNKNCGSWYIPPTELTTATEVYFKSSDGHRTANYAFSLKRLNLPLIELLHRVNSCFLVDSSVRKILPDSFSRTIPVWCCVMNRIVQKYRTEMRMMADNNPCAVDDEEWDTSLYTPESIVSQTEYLEILSLIESRVEILYASKAIVNPCWLVRTLTRPLRPMWITDCHVQRYTNSPQVNNGYHDDDSKYFTIICCNPSYYAEGSSSMNHIYWVNQRSSEDYTDGFYYTAGSADDDSEWGRRLTPEMFWAHHEEILQPKLTDDDTDAVIDAIVQRNRQSILLCDHDHKNMLMTNTDKIGKMDLWIGGFEAGKPPDCWENFDAILNVAEPEYFGMHESIKEQLNRHQKKCYYLQLPVAQGKRDKTELERWMPVGLVFLIHHLQQKRRVLVHGTKGRDRAVAVVLALVVLACPPTYPLQLRDGFKFFSIDAIMSQRQDGANKNRYIQSELCHCLVNVLLKEDGRETFLQWMHNELQHAPPHKPFADKESLRIVLQLVTQYRETAEPSRSTTQKLNRFFMSSSLYRHTTK